MPLTLPTSSRKIRLNLTDSAQDVIFKMSSGNAGAINVLVQLLKHDTQPVDRQLHPYDALMGYGRMAILHMDYCRIYGEEIWLLYKDVCGESLVRLMAVLRANQLGRVSMAQIRIAMQTYGAGIDPDKLLQEVQSHEN